MFSINLLEEKVKKIKLKLTFTKYVKKIIKDADTLGPVLIICLVTGFLGSLLGGVLSEYLSNFLSISTEQSLIHAFLMGILTIYSVVRFAYKCDYELEQLKSYTLSQEEMKEYIRILPQKRFKEQALKLIEEEAKENLGKVSFYSFKKIYNTINEQIEIQKLVDDENSKKEKGNEITECLMKTLEKEVYDEKELIIEQKQEQNII